MVNLSRFPESILRFLYGAKVPLQGIIVGSGRITRYSEKAAAEVLPGGTVIVTQRAVRAYNAGSACRVRWSIQRSLRD